MYSRGRK